MMIKRVLEPKISRTLRTFPAVALLGARQTGKTTLAKMIAAKLTKMAPVYLDLELPSDANKLADPELYLEEHRDRLVIIDEIQRQPGLFPVLRALIDRHRKPGRFLLLGSASPDILQSSSETLAGRIDFCELGPFSRTEISKRADIRKHWWRGGYPDALLARTHGRSREWVNAFIRTYLERDLPQLGIRVPAPELRKLLTFLANEHGNLLNYSNLARSLGYTVPTIKHHLSILENNFQINSLRSWQLNIKKRLIKSPKIYLRDSGILHALLDIRDMEDLMSRPIIGASYEGYVIEQIRLACPEGISLYFWRSNAGAEIDLLLVRGQKVVGAVEIKYSLTPVLQKGFYEAMSDLRNPPAWVIYPGKEKYRLHKDITACPLDYFIRNVLRNKQVNVRKMFNRLDTKRTTIIKSSEKLTEYTG